MKIVFLDSRTITDCGITLDPLKKYGEVFAYEIVKPQAVKGLIKNADAVFCNKSLLTAENMCTAKHLKYIGVTATGVNNIDLDYCRTHGITVCNAGSYSTENVAQQVFAFMLEHCSKISKYNDFVQNGGWIKSPSFSPLAFRTTLLADKTLGIVGFGSIGKTVAKIAKAFGMKVIVHTSSYHEHKDIEFVSFDDLLMRSDFVSVHCPLTAQTENLFDESAFAKMKDGAFFINTARGPITDESALRNALESGKLSGAAVDVLCREPMEEKCPLYKAKNIMITPHSAWTTFETKERLMNITVQNFESFLNGKTQNKV